MYMIEHNLVAMTTSRAMFTGFEPFSLTGVRMTDKKLGHGSYATVQELEYMGLKCAGKKIHDLLLEQGDTSYTLHRFEEECRLLSQVRHPNIVQFLGVLFQQGMQVPILVMEFLPTNLTSCVEQYGILPKEINYSTLHDVALGLCYLHSQTPPIIHRDLSSNNVLLTANMMAKISDLGVARILNLSPLQVSRMTQTPGTPAYMPPEVMVANPGYDTSVDEFSYGILMIHMFSGRWPEPQVGQTRIEAGKLIPVTEAERREVFLRAIGKEHPLMDLILRLINNDPQVRPHASEIVERLAAIVLQFPASFANRLEMLRHIGQQEEEKKALREKVMSYENDQQLTSLREEMQKKTEENIRQNLVYSGEIEQLKIQARDLESKNILLKTVDDADKTEMSEKLAQKSKDCEQYQIQIAEQKDGYTAQLTRERERCRNLTNDNHMLQAEISQLRMSSSALEHKISTLEATKDATIKRKETELEAQSRALEEKDSIITEMNQQLTRSREYLTSRRSVQAGIVWKQCVEMPGKASGGKSVVIDGKAYYGGGGADNAEHQYTVLSYHPLHDNWTALPPLPVKWFGLGQVNGKLVAVGGRKRSDLREQIESDEVYTYNERSKKWKQTIPPMPTARSSPGVLSLEAALVVAGGTTSSYKSFTDTVEIFKPDSSQWYTTHTLPTPCCNLSLVAIGNTCYALGGYRSPSHLNQALYASVDDLIHNAVPANQTTHSGSSDTRSAWKSLPDTPTYRPATAVLAGKLFAVGGMVTSGRVYDKKEIYMYSSSTNSWMYFGDLPAPRSFNAVAVLSSTEVVVFGGLFSAKRVNAVYKGALELEQY